MMGVDHVTRVDERVFQFYISTIMIGNVGHPVSDASISILHKYDYDYAHLTYILYRTIFQFYISTIMMHHRLEPHRRAGISILHKYDYDRPPLCGKQSLSSISILHKYDYDLSTRVLSIMKIDFNST